jgi:hypothetical protein
MTTVHDTFFTIERYKQQTFLCFFTLAMIHGCKRNTSSGRIGEMYAAFRRSLKLVALSKCGPNRPNFRDCIGGVVQTLKRWDLLLYWVYHTMSGIAIGSGIFSTAVQLCRLDRRMRVFISTNDHDKTS